MVGVILYLCSAAFFGLCGFGVGFRYAVGRHQRWREIEEATRLSGRIRLNRIIVRR